MTGTLGDLFRVAAAGASPALLPSEPLEQVLRLADQLPPTPAAGFERTLGREAVTLDFALQFRPSDPCGMIMIESARSGYLDALGWSGVPGLLRALGDGGPLAGQVAEVWLEFDASRGDSQPSVFAAPAAQDGLADLVVALRRASGRPPPAPSVLATIDALHDQPGEVFQVGLMLARADDAVRICLHRTGAGGMATVLEACGGSARWLIPRLPRDRVTGRARLAFLAFDLTGDGIRDRIGVELIPPSGPAAHPLTGWVALLDALEAAGLCFTSERDDLLAYFGDATSADGLEHWPANLTGFDELPAGPVPVVSRGGPSRQARPRCHAAGRQGLLRFPAAVAVSRPPRSTSMSIPAPTPVRGAPLSDELRTRPTAYASGAPWPTVMAGHLDWIAEHRARETPVGAPLVSVLSAFVDRAVESLVIDPDLLAAPAVGQLHRWLLDRLAGLSGRVLELERRAYRAAQGTALHHLLAPTEPEDDDFAAHLLSGGLAALVREYPTWARLVTELMATWRVAVDELVTRLAEDRPLIAERLCGGVRLGPVTHLLSGASDPHDGGRSVMMVGFASGDVVVYKPRDLRPEAAFATVARWLADRGAPPGPRPLAVVEREGYGWMEFARADPCRTAAEVATFYRRAGALLALVYALCGTDVHHENLVASGSWPALVDAETLLHTVPRRTRRHGAVSEARAILNDSVFGTAMLPIWRRLADGEGYDNSGLGVGRPQRRGVKPEIPVLANVPRLDGVPIAADGHVTEIVDGFTAMYAAILAHRDELAAADGPLARFGSARMRIVLRPSQLYGDLIDSALRPAALRDGAHYWRALRRALADPPAPESDRLAVADRSVLRAELEALEHLDIPRFTTYADRPVVAAPPSLAGQTTGTEPGLDRVRARLVVLGEDDLRRQVSFIRGAFHCRAATGTDPDLLRVRPRPGAREPVENPSKGSALIAQETAVRMATGIASRIHDLAIRGTDGSATWIVPAFQHGGGYLLRPMGLDLYSGTAGVGLFLAALRRVTGEEAHTALAQAAVQGMTQLADRRHAAGFPLGGLHGLGSAIYTLVNLADLLDRPDLLDTARAIARTLDRDMVDRDTAYDLTYGSAGAALALLALAQATDDDEPMIAARRCADHLVRAGPGTPADPSGRLTGCAHGAAGMAHALSRMAEATGDKRYADAAVELIAYENGTFDDAVESWPDLRRDAPAGSFMFGWCNGAPGIGLARLSATALVPRAAEDVAIAARATVAAGRGRRDNLCCGNLGRAAFLAAAGEHRHDHALSIAAASLIRAVVEDADRTGAFALVNDPRAQANHLGFFQGAAGIGFQLLRFAFPGRLPSPLLIE